MGAPGGGWVEIKTGLHNGKLPDTVYRVAHAKPALAGNFPLCKRHMRRPVEGKWVGGGYALNLTAGGTGTRRESKSYEYYQSVKQS